MPFRSISRMGVALALTLGGNARASLPPLLPVPASVAVGRGGFMVDARTPIVVPRGDAGARAAAALFAKWLERTRKLTPRIVENATARAIRFERGGPTAPEAYRLTVTPNGATVASHNDAGLLYGGVTLWQLLTQIPGQGAARAPALIIDDTPRFAWRGLMLDSARHYQSPAFIRALLDAMAASKLNTLHWHLTDDQGWRLQILKYPRLTELGAWRRDAAVPPAVGKRAGGFYTQAEVRAIVAYAAARGITIVPEIEMPGHALSAIRAYPRLGMGVIPPPGIESDWGVFPYLYNPNDRTFAFLEDVLTETMALFPGRYIHVGGDEAIKDQWRASSAVQAKMRALGLKDEDALQGWFVQRIGRFLAKHGRRLIGWDEILGGALAPDATVLSWRGVDGAIAAAKAGHNAVLAPMPTLYFDNRQGDGSKEGPGRAHTVTLADVYAFDPAPPGIAPVDARHILGLQGNLWTEHVRTDARAARMLFPRALAVAEIGWSPATTHDIGDFARRVGPQIERLRALGIESSNSPFAANGDRAGRGTLDTCTDRVRLALEDDAPPGNKRAVFVTDILNPCWIYQAGPMDSVRAIAVDVGQLPFNFQIGADRDKIRFRPPSTPEGELEIRADGCDGAPIAVLPLAPAVANPGVTTLRAPLPPRTGAHDLCLTFTQRGPDPLWAVNAVRLVAP